MAQRARDRRHHKDYTDERTFYEQRANRYEQRQQEIHNQMFSIAKSDEKRSEAIHTEILQLFRNQVIFGEATEERSKKYDQRQADIHDQMLSIAKRTDENNDAIHNRMLRIYGNQALIGEKYGARLDNVFEQQEAYARGMAEITTMFKDVLENIKGISGFKVEEGKLAVDAIEMQAKAAQILPQIQAELDDLRRERDDRMDDLLQDSTSLRRSRHEFTQPDRDLQATILQFRIKMDGLSKRFLDKYVEEFKYWPVFFNRGIIAFLDGDILTAHNMFGIAEKMAPFVEAKFTEMNRDDRIRIAFTQFYLALFEKNYGNIHSAKDHIEKSYRVYGEHEESEFLTLVTFAEIFSYLPEGLESARHAIKQLIKRAKARQKANVLTRVEEQYLSRAHLIYANTFFIQHSLGEARTAYEKVLKINSKNYYAHYALGQILNEEGQHKEAQATFDKVYQYLRDSSNLETKTERSTQISLNALAYMCLRETDKVEAKPYLDSVKTNLAKIREIDSFELKPFSLKKKLPVKKDEFWSELID